MENQEIKASSVSEIIELIKNQFQFLSNSTEIRNLWFRGEKRYDIVNSFLKDGEKLSEATANRKPYTPLLPNAYRIYGRVEINDYEHIFENTKDIENNYKAEFSRKSINFFNQNRIENNEWNKYFLMQHYGLKTRLLDWTENALVAIYFSIEDVSTDDDAVIWILNPHRLNNLTYKSIEGYSGNSSDIYFPHSHQKKDLISDEGKLDIDELCRKYLEMDFNSNEKAYPLAIYPYLFDERMKLQKACFTIFGNEINGLLENDQKDNFLKSILIDGYKKKQIKEELRWLGISKENVYPGLESNCSDILEKYKNNYLVKN
ncbi:FRG domain-containing protein [Flavobacterium sp.]|jgi:hypothetical protein|uniref:FRG domain-containing protein n=1 Tax=Flavobacterium sp. TaxID=239 RepID=UPI0037BFC032